MGDEQKPPENAQPETVLKFSDFAASSETLVFDHNQGSYVAAMGIGDEEFKELKERLTKCVHGTNRPSNAIENIMKADIPMRWKILGIVKVGELIHSSTMAQDIVECISKLPDETPGPLLKAMVLLEIMKSQLGGSR